MSGLDIAALRLTENEKNVGGFYSIHSQQRDYVADAQLAKALWGYREHLKKLESQQTNTMILEVLDDLVTDLGVALEQANIERSSSQDTTG